MPKDKTDKTDKARIKALEETLQTLTQRITAVENSNKDLPTRIAAVEEHFHHLAPHWKAAKAED